MQASTGQQGGQGRAGQAPVVIDEALRAELAATKAQITSAIQAAQAAQAAQGQPPVVVDVRPGGGFQVLRPGSPTAVWEAARQARRELINQLDRLEEQRGDLRQQLRNTTGEADQKGLEGRLTLVDARIVEVEKALAEADANVVKAAAVPGAVQEPRPIPRQGPPEEVFVLAGLFIFVVLLPLSIAMARRIWRRSAAAVSAIPQEIYDRFNRLDQAIDSVAIEVERIGEGQRFLTRTYSDLQRGLGAGAAERIELPDRERVGERPR